MSLGEHGTRKRYNNGCGCRPCKQANSDYIVSYRKTRKGAIPHGTADGYGNWNCRCPRCLGAWKRKNR